MDFTLTDDQQMLRDSIQKMLAGLYPSTRTGFAQLEDSGDFWDDFTNMGLTALPFDEAHGGLEGSSVDTMVVMEELGRALATDPYLAHVVLSGAVIRLAASEEQKSEIATKIAEGTLRVAAAFYEPHGRYDLAQVACQATPSGDGYILAGAKSVVLGGDRADKLIISARTSGETHDQDGISLFICDADAPGIERRCYRTIDGLGAAEISITDVQLPKSAMIGQIGTAYSVMEHAVDHAVVARMAEAIGAMEMVIDMTREYLLTRQQFGQPLARFQAMQHKFADMIGAYEQALSMTYLATSLVQSNDVRERQAEVSGAAYLVGQSARLVAHEAIQMHGGIGMTEEYALGDYIKRLTAIGVSFGDEDHHLRRHGQVIASEAAHPSVSA